MVKNLKSRNLLLLIPVALLLTLLIFIYYFADASNRLLSFAFTLDLLLTIPFVYFLVIRKTKIPNYTFVPVMLLGLICGYNFLPPESHDYLNFFKLWILPFVELSVLGFIIYKVVKTIRLFNAHQQTEADFYDALKSVCQEIFPPRLVAFPVMEIAVFYYGFINWKKKSLSSNEFSYYQKSGSASLLYALIFIIAIETIVLHIVLAMWSVTVAWILSLLSIYSAIQIFGIARSLPKRPYQIEDDVLQLKYGILTETNIPINKIESIQVFKKKIDEANELERTLCPFGELEKHNVRIEVKEALKISGLYGLQKNYTSLLFWVDDVDDFVEAVNRLKNI